MKFIWEITEQKRIIAKMEKVIETDNFADRNYITNLILSYPKTIKDWKNLRKILKKVKKENDERILN